MSATAQGGGYHFKRVATGGNDRFTDKPVKNDSSHIGDAYGYMCMSSEHRRLTRGNRQASVPAGHCVNGFRRILRESPAVEGTAITDLIAGSRQRRDSLPWQGTEEHNIDQYNYQSNLLHLLNARDCPVASSISWRTFTYSTSTPGNRPTWRRIRLHGHAAKLRANGPAICPIRRETSSFVRCCRFIQALRRPGCCAATWLAHPLSAATARVCFRSYWSHLGLWRCQLVCNQQMIAHTVRQIP